jgi:hypothetical protein
MMSLYKISESLNVIFEKKQKEFSSIFSMMLDEESSYNKYGPTQVAFGGEVNRFLHTF